MIQRTQSHKFQTYDRRDLPHLPQLNRLSKESRVDLLAISAVLPFRVNNYVLEKLIDWTDLPNDPIFQYTFPQRGMLNEDDMRTMVDLVRRDAPGEQITATARQIQKRLNPHPAGQMELNVPRLNGEPLQGMQHKYRETLLFFPSQAQTCHAYCSYCFRWPQFVGLDELKFASREADTLAAYVRRHPEIKSVLITGGDPLIMKTKVLRRYIEPLLDPGLEHLESIRIGTKAPAYWPYRFLTDVDADDLLRLFEEVRQTGLHLALMAHYTHPRELEPAEAVQAVGRIQNAGAVVRCQAPLLRCVNNSPDIWADLWRMQTKVGAVPYYMFVERDTGARNYYEVPLASAYKIFNGAYRQVSGLARTVRGPSMSTTPGKVVVEGVAKINGQMMFVLKFLQARDPHWVGRPFFAQFDRSATWLDQLKPALGDKEFFFEEEMRKLRDHE